MGVIWVRSRRAGHGAGMESPRVLRFLAVVFTVAAAGSLALVVLDLVIARPAAGDVFITVLNALAAFVLWRGFWKKRGHEERPAPGCRPFAVSLCKGNLRVQLPAAWWLEVVVFLGPADIRRPD
jgi:hypothetical protein